MITGCAGFIGFHTAIALAAQGHEVIGIDNFNSYYDVNLKLAREKELKRRGIDIIHGDICDEHLLPRVVEQFSFTHLIHLAAQAGVRYSLLNPQAYVEANIKGFTTILEFVKSRPEIKLCYASSSSVYGLNTKVPYSVHDSTDRQASFYGVTKKANELMAATYHHLFGISCIGMRFFTVYGPWGRPDMALYSFTQAILQNQPIKVYNFGKMSRDFTYIDDIVCGILAVLDYQGTNELFNLGGHKPVELLYFVELLEKALGMKATIDLAPLQSGDILSTYADITESQEKLGFYPKTSIEEGIPKFVEWYKEYAKGGT
ncbi:MAG: GDP-mannose 4,6-dehydratase [Parachlamydiaceae bacterium]